MDRADRVGVMDGNTVALVHKERLIEWKPLRQHNRKHRPN
jgi:hypothetical protein